MNAEISGGVNVLLPSLMRSTSPGCDVVGEAEREELQLVLNVFDAAAHQALDAVHGAFGSFDQVLAGCIADNDLVAFIQRDDRGNKSARPRLG